MSGRNKLRFRKYTPRRRTGSVTAAHDSYIRPTMVGDGPTTFKRPSCYMYEFNKPYIRLTVVRQYSRHPSCIMEEVHRPVMRLTIVRQRSQYPSSNKQTFNSPYNQQYSLQLCRNFVSPRHIFNGIYRASGKSSTFVDNIHNEFMLPVTRYIRRSVYATTVTVNGVYGGSYK